MTLFPIYEVGSLPKLNARVNHLQQKPITTKDIQQINWYAKKAGIDPEPLLEIIKQKTTPDRKQAIIDWNALANLRVQENTGLDIVYDGEARRSEMYSHAARNITGFQDLPEMIRCRGPDSWKKNTCEHEPHIKNIDEVEKEYNFVKTNARKPAKIPINDPYMIANMTDNKHYTALARANYSDNPRQARYEAKQQLTLALARNVIKPQVKALQKTGATWIQLDAPSATIDLEHIPIFVEGINEVVCGIDDIKFSIHLCYPRRKTLTNKQGYELLFPHILNLDKKITHLSLELANTDNYEKDLEPFIKHQQERAFELGIGILDITQEKAGHETPELIRQRIHKTAKLLRDPNLAYIAPDCGLRQLTLEKAIQLYETMVQGTELARKG